MILTELTTSSIIERYENFQGNKVTYHINFEPDCAEKHGLDASKPNYALILKDKTLREKPYVSSELMNVKTLQNFASKAKFAAGAKKKEEEDDAQKMEGEVHVEL